MPECKEIRQKLPTFTQVYFIIPIVERLILFHFSNIRIRECLLYLVMGMALPMKTRINSIDVLRGIVMVVMALDHVRDYFSGFKFEPTDLQHAGTGLFFTRWVTHYCAPVFIFLSGTSAGLSAERESGEQRGRAWRLLTRGLWLIVLEVTVVRLGWAFDVNYSLVFLQVIWAIGISMVALSGLIFLPRLLIVFIGLVMIFGHNLLDGVHPAGSMGVLWDFLHVQGPLRYGHGNTLFIIYPLIPWIGVMAVGYCFGAIFRMEEGGRNRWLYGIGLGAMTLFVALRGVNGYGDPSPWHAQGAWWRTVLSFINCSKYPPSLLYLLMTLGPAIAAMPLLERMSGRVGGVFKVYGRVPLFYYILHIYLVHGLAVGASYLFRGGEHVEVFSHPGYSLGVVYGVWVLAVVILYFPCRWFMGVKMRRREWWWSYL